MTGAVRGTVWSLVSFRSASTGFRFPAEVLVVAVRWYLRYGLPYRDVEELLARERPAQTRSWKERRTVGHTEP
jgi:transposase-like protein